MITRYHAFLDEGEELFEAAPVEHVQLHDLPRRRPNEAGMERAELQLLRAIFGTTGDASDGTRALADCPRWRASANSTCPRTGCRQRTWKRCWPRPTGRPTCV